MTRDVTVTAAISVLALALLGGRGTPKRAAPRHGGTVLKAGRSAA